MAKYKYIVTEEDLGLSIKQILKAKYRFSSRFYTKMKYQNLIDLNGVPSMGWIKPELGDVIEIRLPEETSDFPPEDIPIEAVYEDDDLLIINKQPGVTVHPTKGHPEHTMANGIMKYMIDNGQSYKIRFANRLDMDTSGIVIVAKNANAQNDISQQMKFNNIRKKYKAIVHGNVEEDSFTIDLPIGRPPGDGIQRAVMEEGGKDAITDVNVLERYGDYTLVELVLHTGRTHQIRVHLSHIGHPIVGDELYGGEAPELMNRQALHSYYIALKHPVSGEEIELKSNLPEDMVNCITLIGQRS